MSITSGWQQGWRGNRWHAMRPEPNMTWFTLCGLNLLRSGPGRDQAWQVGESTRLDPAETAGGPMCPACNRLYEMEA